MLTCTVPCTAHVSGAWLLHVWLYLWQAFVRRFGHWIPKLKDMYQKWPTEPPSSTTDTFLAECRTEINALAQQLDSGYFSALWDCLHALAKEVGTGLPTLTQATSWCRLINSLTTELLLRGYSRSYIAVSVRNSAKVGHSIAKLKEKFWGKDTMQVGLGAAFPHDAAA